MGSTSTSSISSFNARLGRRIGAGLCASMLVLAAGCNTVHKVDIGVKPPAEGWIAPTAVDIQNFHGNITIEVDPTVTTVTPITKVRATWWMDDVIRKDAVNSVKVHTRTIDQDGRSVLSIRTSTTWHDPSEVWVNLTLKMPHCDGARIYNRGGAVKLEGVSGALQIDNGALYDNDAPIEVRTDLPMNDPVVLVTDRGTVVYQIGPGSTGQFTLDSADGNESFSSDTVQPSQVHSDGKVTTAAIEPADNPVLLRTAHGDALCIHMEHPQRYTNKLR